MKTIPEIRKILDFNPSEQASSVRYLKKQVIDWDVFLPSIGKNLRLIFPESQRSSVIGGCQMQ